MIVLHWWQHLHDEVEASIKVLWPDVTMLETPRSNPWEPWETIRELWGTDDLILLGQHEILHPAVRGGFDGCSSPWCVYPHELHTPGNWCSDGMCCVRFRRWMQQEVPAAAVEDYWGSCWDCGTADRTNARDKPVRLGCHKHIDGEIGGALRERGYTPCVHQPGVKHWKVYHPEERCELV